MKPRLGVNIDHIATLRQVRGEVYPRPFEALAILKKNHVSQVTVHLRGDRRHIQDQDVVDLCQAGILPVNLELALTSEMMKIAGRVVPQTVTLVPEKRREITTEGGLNCLVSKATFKKMASDIARLQKKNIHVSLFVDPDLKQIQAAYELNANAVEIHTGQYCHTIENLCHRKKSPLTYTSALKHPLVLDQLAHIDRASEYARCLSLKVYAGHGLHRHNLKPIVDLKKIEEYNIGHALVAHAVFVGLNQAIQDIQNILKS